MISFSLAEPPTVSTCVRKLRSITWSMVDTAVDAPGDAPSIATMEPSPERRSLRST
jgi:hypothetical protein